MAIERDTDSTFFLFCFNVWSEMALTSIEREQRLAEGGQLLNNKGVNNKL